MSTRALPFLPDIYQEHLDEAAFLWTARERALSSPEHDALTVATGLEDRLLAHLDALAAGGADAAKAALWPALEDVGDPPRLAATAFALLTGGAPEAGARIAAMRADAPPEAQAALARAFELLDEMAADSRSPLEGDRLVQGTRAAWDEAVAAVRGPTPSADVLLTVALGAGEAEVGLLADQLERLGAPAVFAIGFTGHLRAVDALVPWLADQRIGPIAGEAFAAITGLKLQAAFVSPDQPEPLETPPLEVDEADDPAADLLPGPDVDLPRPAADQVKAWWLENRSRFDPRQRYLRGRPRDGAVLRDELLTGPLRRAHALALDVAVRTGGAISLRTRGWMRRLAADLSRGIPLDGRQATRPYSDLLTG